MRKYKKDITKYGEEIPTNFAWIEIEKQKKIANRLANIEKNNKENEKKVDE